MSSHLLSIFLFVIFASLAFLVYSQVWGAPAHTDPAIPIPYTNKEGTVMPAAVQDIPKPTTLSFSAPAIPPIDVAAPKKTETATFAMG